MDSAQTHLHRFSNTLEITKDQAVEFETSISKYLLFLDQPEKVEQPLSKGNLDN
jgi:hypothetical protein